MEKSRRIGVVRDRGGELSYLGEKRDAARLGFLGEKKGRVFVETRPECQPLAGSETDKSEEGVG